MKLLPLLILFFISCAEDLSRDRPFVFPPQNEETSGGQNFPNNTFSTRLTNNLLIEGEQCRGGEVVDGNGESHTCLEGNWLITVDNVNTCTVDGCTTVEVNPIIAMLIPNSGDTITTFYRIDAVHPVNAETTRILNSVFVRTRPPEDPLVLFRQ